MAELLKHSIPKTVHCSEPGDILIYHPGYEDTRPLLRLLGFDTLSGSLWRDVAYTACAIISNNRFDGELRGQDGLVITDDIITPGKYEWHVPGDHKYAIIAEFRSWRYPESVPELWTSSGRLEQQRSHCFITGQTFGKENAHIVPRSETVWFEDNQMGRLHCSENLTESVDDPDNIMSLRSDLHTALDQKLFAFFPKQGQMVINSMASSTAAYHNVPLVVDVRRELLLARFAWTILPTCLLPWLKTKQARMLFVEENGKLVAKEISGEACHEIAHALIPRSTSPKKRNVVDIPLLPTNTTSDSIEHLRGNFDSGIGSSDEEDSAEVKAKVLWEERTRGRKRLRGDY